MKRMVLIVVTILAVVYVGVCVAVFLAQRSLIYFPQPRAVTAPRATLKLPVEGAELVVTVRPHAGSRAIICLLMKDKYDSGKLAPGIEAPGTTTSTRFPGISRRCGMLCGESAV